MKKCPTCDKTYEDSMRFCQVDGSALVDDEPAFDPYATIVARPGDVAPLTPPADAPMDEAGSAGVDEAPAMDEPPPMDISPAVEEDVPPIAEPEDVLDLPEADPLKTMYVSEAEMQAAMGGAASPADEPFSEAASEASIDTPVEPEMPSFTVPDVPSPSFGEPAPPPSPFTADSAPLPPADDPSPRPFDEAPTIMQPPGFETPGYSSPTEAPVAEWTPPPAPDASWQNQPIGANTPFQPPASGTGSVNQTLPIISLVLGIVSLCCYISPVTGLAAIITGFLGMKNANNDPANYGGKGLAIAGMIVGGIMFLVGAAYYVMVILIWAGMLTGSVLQGIG